MDSGCTGECIISQSFANTICADIQPSPVKAAKLADKETSLPIVGVTTLRDNILGNSFSLNALVSRDGDPVLIGIPGAEKLMLVINTGQQKLTFRNGASVKYRAVECTTCSKVDLNTVNIRRLLLRTPSHRTFLTPGDDLHLDVRGSIFLLTNHA